MEGKVSKRTIVKKIVNIILAFAIALPILLGKSQNVYAAEFSETTASNPTFYESGCLKSLDITIKADRNYATAYGKIAVHSGATAYNWNHRYSLSGDSWPETINDPTMIAISNGEFKWSDGNRITVTVTFEDNKIRIDENKTYRVYLWTRASAYGIYTDAEFPSVSTEDGVLKFGGTVVDSEPTTHNHTGNYGLTTTNKSNDTLTWYCSETDCTSGATSAETAKKLTLVAPTDSAYNGYAKYCTLTGKEDFKATTGAIISNITYYKKGETTPLISAPSEIGTYVAKITATDSVDAAKTVTAEVEFSIMGTVAYESNGGSWIPSVRGIALPAILPTPTKDGFTFDGWFTDRELTKEAVAGAAITSNTTLYAKWTANSYTVTLNDNGGSGGTSLTSYTYGTGAVLPTDWTKKGYSFDGWYDNVDCTGTEVTDISATDIGSREYWAKWKDDIAPVIGTLSYSNDPKTLWQWLIGKGDLIITVPVTEEGSGADVITYTATSEDGTTSTETSTISNNEAKITVAADFKGTISIVCTDKADNTSAGVTAGVGLDATGIIIEDHAPLIAFKAENAESLQTGEYMEALDIAVTVTDNRDNAVSGGIASVSYRIGNGTEKAIDHDYTTSMVVTDSFMIPASEIPAGETIISVTATDHAGNSITETYTVKVHVHKGTVVPAAESTCTMAGNKEYYTCTCGKMFSDSGCTTEVTTEEVKTAAFGHDWSGNWVVTKEPTATEDGAEETACTHGCGEKQLRAIPATGDQDAGKLEKEADVEEDAPIAGASFNNEEEELLEADGILTTEEKAEVTGGKDVKVWLEISNTVEDEISETDKTSVIQAAEQVLGDDAELVYFDVDLFKQMEGGEKTQITEPGINIEVTIKIPDTLLNHDETILREYKIIRLHNGEVTVISGDFDAETGEFSFATDKFSTYAIAYSDTQLAADDNTDDGQTTEQPDTKTEAPTTEAPKTGDDSNPSFWTFLMLMSMTALVGLYVKNRKNEGQDDR